MSKIKVKLDSDEIFVLVELLKIVKDSPSVISKISGNIEENKQTIKNLHKHLEDKMLDSMFE